MVSVVITRVRVSLGSLGGAGGERTMIPVTLGTLVDDRSGLYTVIIPVGVQLEAAPITLGSITLLTNNASFG